jgi:hypothetical protein
MISSYRKMYYGFAVAFSLVFKGVYLCYIHNTRQKNCIFTRNSVGDKKKKRRKKLYYYAVVAFKLKIDDLLSWAKERDSLEEELQVDGNFHRNENNLSTRELESRGTTIKKLMKLLFFGRCTEHFFLSLRP